MGSASSRRALEDSKIITTNLKEIQQNVTTMNHMVNGYSMDRQTTDQRTELCQLRSSTLKVLTDTHRIFKDFDDIDDEKFTIRKKELVGEFKTELMSFEKTLFKIARLEEENIKTARARIDEQIADVNDISKTLTSLDDMRLLFLDSWADDVSGLLDTAIKLQNQIDK